jgi:LUD domain
MNQSDLIEKTVKNLIDHGFKAVACADGQEAVERIMAEIDGETSVGFGGSATMRQLGIPELAKAAAREVYDHWQEGLSAEEVDLLRHKHLTCDLFLTSSNAVSATGEIVNKEGFGNRTNALTFGPKKAIVVIGMNKLAPDLDGALALVETVAAPLRAKSLGLSNPCVDAGECVDCDSDTRICCITSILHRRPMGSDITVLIVNEKLGF